METKVYCISNHGCQFVEQLVGVAEGTYWSWSFCTR
uniref:Uncharacterized protein n=1 Tax=Arundo donax TaxID=35708 RepID=A0A0A9E2G6_ARUDO